MRIRWLGWAGVELEVEGEHLVIDPLEDAAAVFRWMGDAAESLPRPKVAQPRPRAVGGLVTHLHRDHADASALSAALAAGAAVYEPHDDGGSAAERLAIAQADHELTVAGLERRGTQAWTSVTIGPFTVTAVPAVDGTGDPQVSWLVEAGGKRALHLGDTMFHGWWWRIAQRFGPPHVVLAPINGARLSFPHRRPRSPLPAAMDPAQAALAAELLQAERLVPIHYGGYSIPGVYEPVPDALAMLRGASTRVSVLDVGEAVELE
jgi:L-ascorbate metabolism protein UlaG (beta-lactamase superfamily)